MKITHIASSLVCIALLVVIYENIARSIESKEKGAFLASKKIYSIWSGAGEWRINRIEMLIRDDNGKIIVESKKNAGFQRGFWLSDISRVDQDAIGKIELQGIRMVVSMMWENNIKSIKTYNGNTVFHSNTHFFHSNVYVYNKSRPSDKDILNITHEPTAKAYSKGDGWYELR